ncbi:flavoprotein oxygenase [Pyricularia oryzae 70-15]|uniref:Flavoprotein oxygenase n=1 Tax=Pyricularia oryzae (strain 70-15 / ATCC MYA-4617 / FGSC 8958) TaxID=242507 RepID=G4N069_PYRO7|nr:flavoprotein oxygenase [Pyricularia oryzae 70-15]EHA53104.1 flavoprotein oxygenase [Pyricularia oryzae 70-15]KAI7914696.1 flavoprotein oxygenase [Pyricularia oryzae]
MIYPRLSLFARRCTALPASISPSAALFVPFEPRSSQPHHHNHHRYYSDPRSKTANMSSAAEATARNEAALGRNPHGDFKSVEASRPPFDGNNGFRYTQTPAPEWKYGSGANTPAPASAKHITIDPYAPDRPARLNYKLLIGAVVPRPIAFVSTVGADGSHNLAPFSYFNMINHDPPLFVIGFASAASGETAKDTVRHLSETGECVINIISESFVEAANATSVNAPHGVSEWDISGLTPVRDCETVKPPRVGEAIFSVEGKVESLREFQSKSTPGKTSGTMAVIEGTRFWVREDAINAERDLIDPKVLRPISRLGGITYGRTTEAFELTRPDFEKDVGGQAAYEKLKSDAATK